MFSDDINIAQIAAITAASSVIGMALGILTAYTKALTWLTNEFKDMRRYVREVFDTHENKDQQRHEDNIIKLTMMEVKLDTVIKNGHSA